MNNLEINETWIIVDWANNICFNGQSFHSFDDAEDFLASELSDYETDRQEYFIVLQE